jgi:hypothetical protein
LAKKSFGFFTQVNGQLPGILAPPLGLCDSFNGEFSPNFDPYKGFFMEKK